MGGLNNDKNNDRDNHRFVTSGGSLVHSYDFYFFSRQWIRTFTCNVDVKIGTKELRFKGSGRFYIKNII